MHTHFSNGTIQVLTVLCFPLLFQNVNFQNPNAEFEETHCMQLETTKQFIPLFFTRISLIHNRKKNPLTMLRKRESVAGLQNTDSGE